MFHNVHSQLKTCSLTAHLETLKPRFISSRGISYQPSNFLLIACLTGSSFGCLVLALSALESSQGIPFLFIKTIFDVLLFGHQVMLIAYSTLNLCWILIELKCLIQLKAAHIYIESRLLSFLIKSYITEIKKIWF